MSEGLRIVRLAVLGSISILPLLILPTMVGGLVDYAGLTEAQAGWISATGSAGAALAAITIALRIRHLDPRRLALYGLLALVLFDALSALIAILPTWGFYLVRGLAGVAGAAAYAAVMTSYAAMPNAERGYGTFIIFQFTISGLGLYALPHALPYLGVPGMYLCLAVAAALGLTQVPAVISRRSVVDRERLELRYLVKPAAILAMVGIGLFETANNMHFTYAERIGVGFGLPNVRVGEALLVSSLLGIPAAFTVVWLGDRFGELRPILIAVAAAIAGLLTLLAWPGTGGYWFAMCILGMAWAFGLPFFQAFEARLDPGGSVVVAGGFFTAVGGAIGPALAASLVSPGAYAAVLLTSSGIYLGIGVIMTLAARLANAPGQSSGKHPG